MAADPGKLPLHSIFFMFLAWDSPQILPAVGSSVKMDNIKLKYGIQAEHLSPTDLSHSPMAHGLTNSGSWGSDVSEKVGYEYEFVIKVDDKYECPICCYTLRNANQTKCGHRFCGSCIRKWIRDQRSPGGQGTCPVCMDRLAESDLFEDNFAKREILCLHIYCPNRRDGCTITVELRNVDKHLTVCGYVLVQCPMDCGDWMLRKDIEEHQKTSCERRKIKCHICGGEVPIDKKDIHLSEECPMLEVVCCYCSARLKRVALEVHKEKDCPKVLVNCHYKSFGCNSRMEREQLETHLEIDTQQHMKMLGEAVEKLKKTQPVISDLLSSYFTKRDLADSSSIPSMEQPYRHAVSSRTPSPPNGQVSRTHPLDSMLRPRENTYSDLAYQRHTHPATESLTLHMPSGYSDPFPRMIHQHHPSEHKLLRRQTSLGQERAHGHSGYQNTSLTPPSQDLTQILSLQEKLERKVQDQQQEILTLTTKQGTLEQQIKEQAQTIQKQEDTIHCLEARNCDGKFVWKIDNYRHKKYEAASGQRTVIHSPSFTTSMFGYKLCVRLNLNGVDSATGTHISLFVHFMQGDYDDILDWPFSGKIALAILDQNESSASKRNVTETLVSKPSLAAFQRPRSHRNHKGFGYVEFCPLTIIENSESQYLKNDTIYIKVTVDND